MATRDPILIDALEELWVEKQKSHVGVIAKVVSFYWLQVVNAILSHSLDEKSYSEVPPPSNHQTQQSRGFSTPNLPHVPSNSKSNHFQPGKGYSQPNVASVSVPHPPAQGVSSGSLDSHQGKPGKMPPKMKEYVTRAFASASSEEERDLVHQFLDDKLNKIFAENKQWTIDWERYPMPL